MLDLVDKLRARRFRIKQECYTLVQYDHLAGTVERTNYAAIKVVPNLSDFEVVSPASISAAIRTVVGKLKSQLNSIDLDTQILEVVENCDVRTQVQSNGDLLAILDTASTKLYEANGNPDPVHTKSLNPDAASIYWESAFWHIKEDVSARQSADPVESHFERIKLFNTFYSSKLFVT